jgi:predicted acylesterase/phospholipase RssA
MQDPTSTLIDNNYNIGDIWMPSVLVLGPGGVKGFNKTGFLCYLEQVLFFKQVNIIIGVSVGSIIGCLMVVGYSIKEIIDMTIPLNIFDELSDYTKHVSRSGLSRITKKIKDITNGSGLLSGDVIRHLLKQKISNKWGKGDITLKELYDYTGIRLVCTVTNCSDRKAEYFDYLSEPNCSVIEAVLMSAAIPGVFYKRKYNGKYYHDGAIANPYPVKLFDDGKTNILGIYIETNINHEESNALASAYDCTNIQMGILKKIYQEQCTDHVKHVEIISEFDDVTGINVSDQDKYKMIYTGWNEGKKFYNNLLGIKNTMIIVPHNLSLDEYIQQCIDNS